MVSMVSKKTNKFASYGNHNFKLDSTNFSPKWLSEHIFETQNGFKELGGVKNLTQAATGTADSLSYTQIGR